MDYSKLKFKSGLEIHQQLDTHKLFCNCPSILRGDLPDFYVERKLHAVAGESGEVDRAAEYQASLKKTFVYQGYRNSTCLIELDEEPPHEINEDALKIALQIALLLNCKIIPVTQIMRKTVIDGSNTSGFQRTVLIARDGYVETAFGRVGIETICLEEDAARKVKVEGEKVYWNLDRLGIPLVEIATSPDIKSAEQAKEVAMYIGDVLRSCKVKRGIGTIRQDVNISILEGNRVEMKGVQDMRTFIKTIENEVLRQKELYDEGTPTQPEVRNALPDCSSEFLRPMPGADRMYPETDLPLLKLSRDFIDSLKKDLPKLRSESAGELRERGLSEEMVKLILGEDKIEELKSLAEIYSNLNFIAKMIVLFPKEIASKENKTLEEVEEQVMDYYGDILRLLNKKKIVEGDVKDILINLVKGMDFKEAIKIEKVDNSEIEEEILKIIKEKPGLNANAYMGLVMAKFKGKINGKQAMDVINKLMNK
ncbi:Glu-tRNA(Gln) amidotransferase subunit GatE [Candidatus Pacearchaeota archaeon]|nr:Glu-tRNA(Gln) amidotransferase subunit GatE [Candidatus Pacearchaeota archaeon]